VTAGMTAPVTPVVVPGPAELAEAAAAWTAIVCGQPWRSAAPATGLWPAARRRGLLRAPGAAALQPWVALGIGLRLLVRRAQVPLDDPTSNYAMAKAALLDHVPIPPSRFFRWSGPDAGPPPYSRERAWVASLRHHPSGAGGGRPHGLAVSGQPALQEAKALVARVSNAPKPPRSG